MISDDENIKPKLYLSNQDRCNDFNIRNLENAGLTFLKGKI